MKHANFIASEYKKVGFEAKALTGNCIKISLKNRKPSKQEVEFATEQIFDGEIFFRLISSYDGILAIV